MRNNRKSKEEILNELKEYFGDTKYSVEACGGSGVTIYLDIEYWDFKIRRIVRKEIEEIASNIYVDNLERQYSKDSIVAAVNDMDDIADNVYIKLHDGSLKYVTVSDLIFDVLERRSFV